MKSIDEFFKMKQEAEKIVMMTASDYPSARYANTAGVDCLLVGDSLGMVVLGYENTLFVTMEDMLHHTKAARRGASDAFIIADMPYLSYHLSTCETKKNAARFICEAGADAVKLEGGTASRLEAIRAIIDCNIPVVAHLGLTPQSVYAMGGYKLQGKTIDAATRIREEAHKIEAAGAFMLVLEGIPEALGKEISEALTIPTVGIGAGRYTDGQVLVYHDLLGMGDLAPKFLKKYRELGTEIRQAIEEFAADVKQGIYPSAKHVYKPIKKA